MKQIKIKVCGVRSPSNLAELSKLDIDYVGFNFYEKSPRYVSENIEELSAGLPKKIKKVGVFVNSDLDEIIELKRKYSLDYVQLHGYESASYCKFLYVNNIAVIKAFQIKDNFEFKQLNDYEKYCHYFLFDNKSKAYGGSSRKFDWDILKKYDNTKLPYFLSGGIDSDDIKDIKTLKSKGINIYGVDINSRFETEPGTKDVCKVLEFTNKLKVRRK
jgi:phosphoribosylanthranilate isomerase